MGRTKKLIAAFLSLVLLSTSAFAGTREEKEAALASLISLKQDDSSLTDDDIQIIQEALKYSLNQGRPHKENKRNYFKVGHTLLKQSVRHHEDNKAGRYWIPKLDLNGRVAQKSTGVAFKPGAVRKAILEALTQYADTSPPSCSLDDSSGPSKTVENTAAAIIPILNSSTAAASKTNSTPLPGTTSKYSSLSLQHVPALTPKSQTLSTTPSDTSSTKEHRPSRYAFTNTSPAPTNTANDLGNKELGLTNLGNTCFVNAALKMLMAYPKFFDFTKEHRRSRQYLRHYLENQQVDQLKDKANLGQKPLEQKLLEQKLIEELRDALHEVIAPLVFKVANVAKSEDDIRHLPLYARSPDDGYQNKLKNFFEKYRAASPYMEGAVPINGTQQDANEFLDKVLYFLGYDQILGGIHLGHRTDFSFKKVGQDEEVLNQVVVTKEKTESRILQLSIPESKYQSVQSLINHHLAPELIEDYVAQEAVRNSKKEVIKPEIRTNATKTNFVSPGTKGVPKNLFVNIKRRSYKPSSKTYFFNNHNIKIDKLTIPWTDSSKIDLNSGSGAISDPPTYHPRAVIVHTDSEDGSGGHYYTYIHDWKNKQWYKHEDLNVSQVKPEDLEEEMEIMETHATTILYSQDTDSNLY